MIVMKVSIFFKPLLLTTIFLLFSSCNLDEENIEKTIIVASAKADCVGAFPQECLLVKENEQQNWEYFYDSILGFTYEEGFEYVLIVSEKEIMNPPQDASSIQTTLIRLVSKIEKSSENLPL